MSEFALVFHGAPPTGSPAEISAQNQKWAAWMRDLGAKGLISNPGQALEPRGKIVTDRTGKSSDLSVSARMVGGVMFVEATDLEHAIRISTGSPIFDSGGTVEVRPVMKL
jgi:hypothetical protein